MSGQRVKGGLNPVMKGLGTHGVELDQYNSGGVDKEATADRPEYHAHSCAVASVSVCLA